MKTTEYIGQKIERLPKGYVFTYKDFLSALNNKEAIIKALNRMVISGKIAKLSKGKYYKPENTVFGKLQPNQDQIVKDLLESEGKTIGYLTVYSIFNKLVLTTQVSNTIQIAKNDIRPTFNREYYTITFIKQKNTNTKENIPLLQILDAIRYIKKIPDSSTTQVCKQFVSILNTLTNEDKSTLVRLAQKYSPATRALLGALLEEVGENSLTITLKKSLNPITQYRLSGIEKVLSNAEKWNIK
ncbi:MULTISPECIES: DUF6088 family protein [Emticicia]|uniref:DUF6088 family protein n=1 Tax=Emticicia TaxID=312278 RepID=UPI0007D8BC7F|nr:MULTISPECIES: DUF6088 family protein [Emticicia]